MGAPRGSTSLLCNTTKVYSQLTGTEKQILQLRQSRGRRPCSRSRQTGAQSHNVETSSTCLLFPTCNRFPEQVCCLGEAMLLLTTGKPSEYDSAQIALTLEQGVEYEPFVGNLLSEQSLLAQSLTKQYSGERGKIWTRASTTCTTFGLLIIIIMIWVSPRVQDNTRFYPTTHHQLLRRQPASTRRAASQARSGSRSGRPQC